MINFYILPKRLHLKRKGLFDGDVASYTKKEYGFAVQFFVKIHKELQFLEALFYLEFS